MLYYEILYRDNDPLTYQYQSDSCFNQLWPLVQAKASRLIDIKPLPESMLTHYQLDRWKQTSGKFELEKNMTNFINENAFENIILFRQNIQTGLFILKARQTVHWNRPPFRPWNSPRAAQPVGLVDSSWSQTVCCVLAMKMEASILVR